MAGLFGLFNYDKEGPGVAKNAPKKRAFVVFFEILGRKMWNLTVAGLMWTLVSLPIITSGLADAGLTFISRNYAREKHAFVRADFFESIKKNWKVALPVGIINTLVSAVLCYNAYVYVGAWMEGQAANFRTMDYVIIGVNLMVLVTFSWMKFYIPFLMITFKLKLKQIYRNAFLFAGANLPVNLLISVVLIAVYALLGGAVLAFAGTDFSVVVLTIVLALAVSVVPGFRSLLIQFCIFPAIKRLIIDPYYEQNPDADKQARLDLNLEVPEDPADTQEAVFTETVQEKKETPSTLPRQYNEKEMRRFNNRVSAHNATDDDDDDTI